MSIKALLITFLFAPLTLFAEKEVTVQSAISEVTIYQQSANITRTAKANLPLGEVLLKFADLHENINPNLVKFNGKGEFSIMGIYHSYKIDTLSGKGNAKLRTRWNKDRQFLVEQIQREQSFLDIYTRELTMLQAHQNFGTVEFGTKVEDLQKAADFLRQRYFDIRAQQIDLEDRIKELNKQIVEIDTKTARLGGIVIDRSLEMYVRVNSKRSHTANLKLTYQMQSAGWYPSYDARVDNIDEPLDLEFTASVYQNTGESWDKVNLTVATGNPNLNTKKPNLLPWYLAGNHPHIPSYGSAGANANAHLQAQGYNAAVTSVTGRVLDQYGEPIPFSNIQVAGTATGTTTDINGYYQLDIPSNGRALTYTYVGYTALSFNISMPIMNIVMQNNAISLGEVQVLSAERALTGMYDFDGAPMNDAMSDYSGSLFQRNKTDDFMPAAEYAPVNIAYSPTNTKYTIDLPYSVPTDGKRYNVTLKTYEMDASYLYQCAPKLDKTAYLTAQITDWEDYNLLAGAMNIYFEDTYVGQTTLNLTYARDTLDISLGADPSIIIERQRINAKSSKQLIGTKRKDVREWEITVRNNKHTDITIQIEDQLPLTSNEDIEIERESLSGGKVDEVTGEITWLLDISKGKTKDVDFKYSIRYPKNMLLAWK